MKKHALKIIFIFAALLRLVYVFTLEDKAYFFDTRHYDSAAQHIVKGEGYGPSLHFQDRYEFYALEAPYPVLLAAVYKIFGHNFLAVRIVQSLLSLLQIWLLFLIARRLSKKVGNWVAIGAAIYPFYIYLSGLIYPTLLFSLLLTATVYFFYRFSEKDSLINAVLAGLFLGAAAATRPVLTPAIPFFLLWVLFLKPIKFTRRLAMTFVMILALVLVFTPWTIRNYKVFGAIAPGRACLAEDRVLHYMNYLFDREHAAEQDSLDFDNFTLTVENDSSDITFLCAIDGKPYLRLTPYEKIDDPSIGYTGLIFKGGEPTGIENFKARQSAAALTHVLDSDSLIYAAADSIVEISSEGIRIPTSDEKWAYRVVYDKLDTVAVFSLTYPKPVKPEKMRRCAVLFGLDEPSLQADGFMAWLHPWKEPDIWFVKNGEPLRPLPIIKRERIGDAPDGILSLMLKYPAGFIFKHFIPEFVNFWSPVILRITQVGNQPSTAMQVVSFFSFTPILLLLPFGLYRLAKIDWRYFFLILIPIAVVSGGYSIFFAEIRYRLPIDGLLIIIAALGIEQLWQLKKKKAN